jgi:valyl-tRNA synthetase
MFVQKIHDGEVHKINERHFKAMRNNKRWYNVPKTIDEAAELLISDLSATHQEILSKLDDQEFDQFYESIAKFVLDDFELWFGNEALLRSCYTYDNDGAKDAAAEPAKIILNRVREMLQEVSGIVIIA